MRKLFYSLTALAFVSFASVTALAQGHYPASRVVLKVRPGATGVKFGVRISASASSVNVYYNDGSTAATSVPNTQLGATGHQTIEYTFTNPSTSEREIVIDASELITLRVVNSTTVATGIYGFGEIVAPKLQNLLATSTDLETLSTVDLSKAPELVQLNLDGTGAEHVILPKNSKLTSIIVSPKLFNATKRLKSINLGDATELTTLAIPQSSFDTIDLRRNPRIQDLNVSDGYAEVDGTRVRVRAILGIKDLNLNVFQGHLNNLGFDQLPNLSGGAITESKYFGQQTYFLHESKIRKNVVDLSHLKTALGINTSAQTTTFVWQMARVQQNASGAYEYATNEKNQILFDNIPADKISVNSLGEYTLDPSLMVVDGARRVRFYMSSAAYPGVGRVTSDRVTYSNNLISRSFLVSMTNPGSAVEVYTSASPMVVGIAGGVQFTSEASGKAQIYALDGKAVYMGVAEGTVSLPAGLYVVRVGNTATKVAVK